MIKTSILISATILGASTPSLPAPSYSATEVEQILLPLPDTQAVVAQFSYLELSHGVDGFELSLTDTDAVFVDFEFAGDVHIRIGF